MEGLIWLLATAALVAVVIVLIVRRKRHLAEELASLSEEERRRHSQIVEADRVLKAAEGEYASRVAQATASLDRARAPQVLDRAGAAVLTELSLELNGKRFPLSAGIRVRLDGTGNLAVYTQSVSATTVAAHALDSRELYLTVTGPNWEESVRIDPNAGEQARRFVAATHTASHHCQWHASQYGQRLTGAQRAHETAVRDTHSLDSARAARAVLEIDPLEELRAARRAAKKGNASLPNGPSGVSWPSVPVNPNRDGGTK